MNKITLVFAPVLAAGIMFGVSSSSFLKSGIPEDLPETTVSSNLSEKGRALLMKEIIDPIQSKKKRAKAEMYSRCPSGVTHYVTSSPSEKEAYFKGKVVDRVGCSSDIICFFRIDKNELVLEAKSKEEQEYLPVAQWKSTAKGETWCF